MRKIAIAALILLVPGLVTAQGFSNSRAKSWEFSIGAIYQYGDSASGEEGSSLDVDDAWGLGFNLGYNFNDHFALSADFEFLRPDYLAVLVDENDPDNITTIDHELSQFNGRLKATFNLLEGPLVPYADLGFGWTYLDSNVADGPPIVGCWWHPWWGYICDGFYNTFSSTETSYGGALGLRYEMRGNSSLKLSYNLWVLDVDTDGRAEPELESIRLEWGWRF